MKTFDEYLKIAQEITDFAGQFALDNFGPQKETFHKSGLEYGIEEDKKCNALYEQFLKEHTPEVSLFTEEGEKTLEAELVWTVDPIDGTSNYSLGNPFWNSQICLLLNGEPVVGVVFAPALGQKFWATKGGGAFLNNKKIEVVEKNKGPEQIVFGMSAGNTREYREWLGDQIAKLLRYFKSPRILSATGLEMVYTAAGISDLFISRGAHIWDYAPGAVIAREAGRVVLNLSGEDWTIQDENILVSNPDVAKQALDLLI